MNRIFQLHCRHPPNLVHLRWDGTHEKKLIYYENSEYSLETYAESLLPIDDFTNSQNL